MKMQVSLKDNVMDNGTVRVAHIMGKMISGGVESVVMNYYRHIDKSKVQFDFIVDEDSTYVPREEIESMGGRVIIVPPYQKTFRYINSLIKVLKQNEYKIVHSHLNALSVFPLYAARIANIPIRIAHSHSTSNKKEWKKNLIKNLLKPFAKINATHYFCCSELAGRWLFGNKTYDKNKVKIINNAININKFVYDADLRNRARKKLKVDDKLVIGHVGRFVEQKNHSKLIDIFYEIYKQEENAVLLLVGEGPLLPEIKEKIIKLNLSNSVMFLGVRNDINILMQCMDVFLFPSLYEGLGLVLIEAQAAGLPCVTSTEVPQCVDITGIVEFVSLCDSELNWANLTIKKYNNNKRMSYEEQINNSGYNIINEAQKIVKIYENEYRKLK